MFRMEKEFESASSLPPLLYNINLRLSWDHVSQIEEIARYCVMAVDMLPNTDRVGNELMIESETLRCSCLDDFLDGTDNATSYPSSIVDRYHRFLEEEEEKEPPKTWKVVYMCLILVGMLIALLSDRVGADHVLLTGLTLCMAAGIITVEEGIEGFSNEGVLTVLVLFVVAAGISKTGALDWYIGKLLGRPKNAPSAQLRLMVPIAIISAFLNNTPVVAVMIPIVQRWGKNVGVSAQQLLIPLSFATILGGTCTLIGTSTNLVVTGLLKKNRPDLPTIGLFDLAPYGVPVAIFGMACIILTAPYLLPGGKRSRQAGGGAVDVEADEGMLLGARVTKWSPAAGRSVRRSGLRDTGGIYLVRVYRASTGNVHHAVGPDFSLNVGDVLYFTGLVETFGDFCEEHGLEVVTNEMDISSTKDDEKEMSAVASSENVKIFGSPTKIMQLGSGHGPSVIINNASGLASEQLESIAKNVAAGHDRGHSPKKTVGFSMFPTVLEEIGTSKESLVHSSADERWRSINRMTDVIRRINPSSKGDPTLSGVDSPHIHTFETNSAAPAKVIVVTDVTPDDSNPRVVLAVSSADHPGLLLDISKALMRLGIQLHHSEASVVGGRSLSVWRCEVLDGGVSDIEEIWSVVSSLFEGDQGIEAMKRRGLRVIRAVVTNCSRIIGQTSVEAKFRDIYAAAIVAVQRGGQNLASAALSQVRFQAGDVLVLQTNDDSPLLLLPPEDFYRNLAKEEGVGRLPSVRNLAQRMTRSFSNKNVVESMENKKEQNSSPGEREPETVIPDGFDIPLDISIKDSAGRDAAHSEDKKRNEESTNDDEAQHLPDGTAAAVWRDLQVVFVDQASQHGASASGKTSNREFLAAMVIAKKSGLVNKSAMQSGLDKLPGITLVSIERPDSSNRAPIPIPSDQPLMEGDVLWFAASAAGIGDLRKIPGLESYESDEVLKLNEKVHDRRLVLAVIARQGPLVGKTVKEVRFRTRYGAAVIAVHRDGKRLHEHPGNVKLHAGDVLLLEAGSTFVLQNTDNGNSFALLSEVEDSTPPRLRMLLPALLLAVAMLAVATAKVASLLVSALVASTSMVIIGILSQQEARDAVDWDVYVAIASAFGIGNALTNSGVAGGIASGLVALGKAVNMGDAGFFGAVYFATALVSQIVTNNAAAALIFPVALKAAEQFGADLILTCYCIMLGSSDFMTPFGYQTNLMVYGPGGYKAKHFFLIGTPLQLVCWIISVTVLSQSDAVPWFISWIVGVGVLAFVSMVQVCDMTPCELFTKIVGMLKRLH